MKNWGPAFRISLASGLFAAGAFWLAALSLFLLDHTTTLNITNENTYRTAGLFAFGTIIVAASSIYLRFVFKQLLPKIILSQNSQATLNSFAQGVIIVDTVGRVVLINKAFAKAFKLDPDRFVGTFLRTFAWEHKDEPNYRFCWEHAILEKTQVAGELLGYTNADGMAYRFLVGATPIDGVGAEYQGALVTFQDVTSLENRKAELSRMLRVLETSRDEVRKQNQQLQVLAMRDPLTGCINRRSLFERLDTLWKSAHRYGHSVSCLMLDVDHFKSINDNYGHAFGDEVLKTISDVMHKTCRDTDIVCRYGGEEFTIVLPRENFSGALQAAHRILNAVRNTNFSGRRFTISIGVSTSDFGASTPQELIEQADKSLYLAKKSGRDRVCGWPDVPADWVQQDVPAKSQEVTESSGDNLCDVHHKAEELTIPFQAVVALVSALSFRDPETADHSSRVADLSVSLAKGRMSARETYLLEAAALLHDIGKIGVPDAILLKPGQLTSEEWEVMRQNDRMGAEIVESAFGVPQLSEIVRNYRIDFVKYLERGTIGDSTIDLCSKIIRICDAFDSMTSRRSYRAGRSVEEAIAELQRCSGTDFDPDLVDALIQIVRSQDFVRGSSKAAYDRRLALTFGKQIEKISEALEKRDVEGIKALAGRLQHFGEKYNHPEITKLVHSLKLDLEGDAQLDKILSTTNDLLEVCRANRSIILERAANQQEVEPAPGTAST